MLLTLMKVLVAVTATSSHFFGNSLLFRFVPERTSKLGTTLEPAGCLIEMLELHVA